jgi:hypothetical protein
MQILDFSKERGIHAIFNGYGKQAYVFHSSWYGFVGYADVNEEPGSDDITVEVYLCNGSKLWYWSLKNIVLRGIRKAENQFIQKDITFNVHYLDKFHGDVPNYDGSIGQPDNSFTISLYDGVREV